MTYSDYIKTAATIKPSEKVLDIIQDPSERSHYISGWYDSILAIAGILADQDDQRLSRMEKELKFGD